MNAITFDTLAFSDKLRAGGFTSEQAKTMTEAVAASFTDQVATKANVEALAHQTDIRFDKMDLRFQKVDTHFERIDARFDGLTAAMEGRFARSDERGDALAADIERHSERSDERLASFERKLEARLDLSDQRLETRIAEAKVDIIRWFIGTAIAIAGVSIAAAKLI